MPKRKKDKSNEEILTKKEQIFIAAFVAFDNATAAGRMAGYSPNSAGVAACRTLQKPIIKARIAAIKERIAANSV